MNSGIGGVMLRLTGEELRLSKERSCSSKLTVLLILMGLADVNARCSSMLALNTGLGARLTVRLLLARLSDLILLNEREFEGKTWPPSGDATTIVPALVAGGGVGLSDRKRGWIWASAIVGLVERDGMKARLE
jgi:hypothetical protein